MHFQSQSILGRVGCEARLPQLPQHGPQLPDVDVPAVAVDNDIVYVGRSVGLVGSQELVHHPLEGGRRPVNAEGEDGVLIEAPRPLRSISSSTLGMG